MLQSIVGLYCVTGLPIPDNDYVVNPTINETLDIELVMDSTAYLVCNPCRFAARRNQYKTHTPDPCWGAPRVVK